MADFNILVGVQSGDAIQKLANVEKGVARVGNATRKTNAQLKAHANQYNKTAVATNKWAKGALQQAGYQIGDFAVQVQGGTNVLQAFGQQGSQLLGIFGPIGAILGAGVAIFAAFGTVLQKTVGSSKETKEAIENIKDETKKANDEIFALTQGLQSLSEVPIKQEIQGALAEIVRIENEIKQLRDEEITAGATRADQIKRQIASYNRAIERQQKIVDENENIIQTNRDANDRLEQIKSEYDDILGSTEGLQQQTDALNELYADALALKQKEADEAARLKKIEEDRLSAQISSFEDLRSLSERRFSIETGLFRAQKDKNKEQIFEYRSRLKLLQLQQKFPDVAFQELKAYAKLQTQREMAQEAQAASLRTTSEGVQELKEEVIKLTPEMEQLMKLSEDIGSKFEKAFMDVVRGTASVKDAFRTMAADIIAELYRVFVVKKITGFITDAVGLFMGPAPGSSASLTTRAVGGPVSAGQPYLVGERGPELMIPSSNGKIIPNNQLGGGGSVVVNQTINVSTGVQQTVRTEIKSLMPQIAESAKAAVADAKRRGGSYGRAFA